MLCEMQLQLQLQTWFAVMVIYVWRRLSLFQPRKTSRWLLRNFKSFPVCPVGMDHDPGITDTQTKPDQTRPDRAKTIFPFLPCLTFGLSCACVNYRVHKCITKPFIAHHHDRHLGGMQATVRRDGCHEDMYTVAVLPGNQFHRPRSSIMVILGKEPSSLRTRTPMPQK